jgi:hypothetical protein
MFTKSPLAAPRCETIGRGEIAARQRRACLSNLTANFAYQANVQNEKIDLFAYHALDE